MPPASLSSLVRCLARGMDVEMLARESDAQLVMRALSDRDVAAIQVIVQRHGAMVYRVCWRVLQHTQDVEDAFQATFLVLAQKLRSLRKHASLASWLHGVARRISVKARDQAAARRRREARASSESPIADDIAVGERLAVLDVELGRLPDKLRLPLVLCYLEGQTQEEAAKRLGWSKSTLRTRLDEARGALARRLSERGFSLSVALSSVLLSDCAASAAPVPNLLVRAAEAAAGVAGGKPLASVAPPAVAALTEGVLKTMLMTKLMCAAAVLIACVGGARAVLSADDPPATVAPPPIVVAQPGPLVGDPPAKNVGNVPNSTARETAAARLKGMWGTVTGEVDGGALSPLEKKTKWVIEDEGITWEAPGAAPVVHKFEVNGDKTPKEIDLQVGGQALKGIYDLDGNTLVVCWGSVRPSQFASDKDSKTALMVLRREKGGPINSPQEDPSLVAKVLGAMEGFRKTIPPDRRGPLAGTGESVKELGPYTFPHLAQVAEGLGVTTKQECLALFAHLKDPDLKLRFIAAHAIDKATRAYPAGLSAEAFLDTGSEAHRRMLLRFLEVIGALPN